jgi:hypothetical protein
MVTGILLTHGWVVLSPLGVNIIVKNKVIGNLTTTCNSLTVEPPEA